MDPPDLISVELSISQPAQHLGRVKSKSPASERPLVNQLPRKATLSRPFWLWDGWVRAAGTQLCPWLGLGVGWKTRGSCIR